MASVKASTIVAASLGTLATGCVAYAVYFDYKRRNDPVFRNSLKRESRKQARAAKEEAEGQKTRERRQIRQMVDEAVNEGFPGDPEDKEAFFAQQVGLGEKLGQQSAAVKEAAIHFFKALKVYPDPDQLMNLYDKMVPKPVLDVLAEMLAYDRVVSDPVRAAASPGGVE